MTPRIERPRVVLAVTLATTVLTIGVAVGCFEPSSAPSSARDLPAASAKRDAAGLNAEIAQLRAVTGRFHNIDNARAAGYTLALTGCYMDPGGQEGGMGYHFGKASALNATVDQLEPEALLYEPQKNGQLKLVGVEYIVPFDAVPSDATPPRAFGLDFKRNFVFNVWALHVWVWKDNPSGLFANYNPDVTCDYAPASAANASHSH